MFLDLGDDTADMRRLVEDVLQCSINLDKESITASTERLAKQVVEEVAKFDGGRPEEPRLPVHLGVDFYPGRSRQRKNTRLGGDLHVSHNKSQKSWK